MINCFVAPRALYILPAMALALVAAILFALVALAQSAMMGTVNNGANLRAGPGTSYAIVGRAQQDG
jgi:uncharacterized protein YraI